MREQLQSAVDQTDEMARSLEVWTGKTARREREEDDLGKKTKKEKKTRKRRRSLVSNPDKKKKGKNLRMTKT